MFKSKHKIEKERQIYEHLKKEMFEAFAKDENGELLIDIGYYIENYTIEYDNNNKPIRLNTTPKKNITTEHVTHNTYPTYLCDDDYFESSIADYYGIRVPGGLVTGDGDLVPFYAGSDSSSYGSCVNMYEEITDFLTK